MDYPHIVGLEPGNGIIRFFDYGSPMSFNTGNDIANFKIYPDKGYYIFKICASSFIEQKLKKEKVSVQDFRDAVLELQDIFLNKHIKSNSRLIKKHCEGASEKAQKVITKLIDYNKSLTLENQMEIFSKKIKGV